MTHQYIPWSDKYLVGIRLIDNDHKSLFTTVNDLHAKIARNAPFDELRQTISELLRYANEHFEREEQLMSQYGYPELASHRRKHHDFIRMVYALRKIAHTHPDRLDFNKLLAFLSGWLKRHIMGTDRDYLPYLTGRRNRRATDWVADQNEEKAQVIKDDGPRDEEISITLSIKLSSVSTLRRCARALNSGGEKALAIEELTDPIKEMDYDDAVKIASLVMKD